MKRIIYSGAILLALAAWGAAPARAQVGDAPWCAVISLGPGDVHWDCHYWRFEDCVPDVLAGNRGFCNHNPRFSGYAPMEGPRKHRRHRHRHG